MTKARGQDAEDRGVLGDLPASHARARVPARRRVRPVLAGFSWSLVCRIIAGMYGDGVDSRGRGMIASVKDRLSGNTTRGTVGPTIWLARRRCPARHDRGGEGTFPSMRGQQ